MRWQTKEEANFHIQEAANVFAEGLAFYYQDKELVVKPAVQSFDIDLSYTLFNVNALQTAADAYQVGRDFNWLISWKDKLQSLVLKKHVPLVFDLDEHKLRELLSSTFDQFTIPVQNATLVQDEHGNFWVRPEAPGLSLDYDQAIADMKQNLSVMDTHPVGLIDKEVEPEIYKKDTLNIDNQAKQLMTLAPLTLKYQDQTRVIEEAILIEWLTLELTGGRFSKEVVVGLNQKKIAQYLQEKIAPDLDQPAIDAKFKMIGQRVSAFQAGQDGWETDLEASAAKIAQAVVNRTRELELVVKESKALTEMSEPEQMGIKEIIGTGHSNFVGSPVNRRHNIKTGANTLNGVLIRPDEEFSLIGVLGEINAASGYLTELVIKENKTIPEYGGGLCQIGTTMFRTALATGLPITMRRNHSYRVSYYEPAGTDATIYSPQPDFRFMNDTGNYILIQYRIDGNDLYFDFWGTKDGRQVKQTKPVIYNIVEPAPTKIIETLDLPVGEKKCTEHAHNGADAYFDYSVVYPNGETKDKRFSSHYVPWQEVCLLGVETLSTTEATSETIATPDSGLGVYEQNKEATAETISVTTIDNTIKQ
ncbi:MAG: VanW family protein [Candidatus Falkowbacteria bacterium GW2011_GWA2_39_24]|uniref:VanW family protein n=1 Tax=Candidatus Falkowbacteria bacterium GW2011_GWA2_39_24 TaxID=1618634 RepID=A0A0G0RHI9_9BACT|nr:MAG: VanW family protein [Candidatus Falkowbacteria bacterium GW2011_GWA2_39_24]